MKYFNLIILLIASVCPLALSACGGGGDSTTNLTKADFVQRAEALCKKAEGEQLQLILAYKKKHPQAEEEELIEPAAIPPLENEISGIKNLGMPDENAAKVDAWVKEFESTLKQVKSDPSTLVDLRDNPFNKANELAAKYGLKTCGGAP